MMEEEVCYSNVLFIKSKEAKPREEQDAEQTVYAEVKKKEVQAEPSPIPSPSPTPAPYPAPVAVSTADDPSLPGPHRYRCAVVVLGLLTAVLLSALVASLVYYQGYVSEYNTLLTHYENTSAANQHLHLEMSQLQQEKKSLMMEWNHLNQTLEVIFHFSDFPVDDYCPIKDNSTERKCSEHCKKGWVYYQSSCYFFHYSSYWKNWAESKTDCTNRVSFLVTIDTSEEQAFINNHTTYYYDEWHGYWIGLSKIQGQWQWVNGSDLTGGYWISNGSEHCALAIPSTDPLKSWRDANCIMKNRWICEMEAATWPD
ncbi:C-type lectin domain family 4 member A isoform X2 [Alosa sapidissima]|uniref:C-type lectin domain family 4 member A isoform X2 n=1 Tax=Alosa sapidissima TaxID=34773 RepID=UPI001C0A220A|nr:C-type lectin domain family 4 member A isoform X2 [Alosa sapidissima]